MSKVNVYCDKKGNELKGWFTMEKDLIIEITTKGYPYTPARAILPIFDACEILTDLTEQLDSINSKLKGNE